MDWSAQISRFAPLTADREIAFAPPHDLEQAISTYNKALSNLFHDSQDIALIALRKLVATYPAFSQPFFLYACCLAERGNGSPESWLNLIEQAIQIGLPEDLHQDALYCKFELQEELKRLKAIQSVAPVDADKPSGPAPRTSGRKRTRTQVPASAVLERTGRSAKVRMASEKERQEVIRRGEFPQEQETHVVTQRDPAEIVRLALPIVAIVLIVATIVLAAVRWLPKTRLFSGNREPSAEERLDWLLDRLEPLAGDEQSIAGLLAEYRATFQPTPSSGATTPVAGESTGSTETSMTSAATEPSSGPSESTAATLPTESSVTTASTAQPTATTTLIQPTESTTTAAPTAAPTATPEPTPEPAGTILLDAWDAYVAAKNIQSEDVLAAADNLLNARSLLATIPTTTTAEGLDRDAAGISRLVENRIDDLANSASRGFRLLAEEAFDNEQWEAALVPYLKAWQIKPDAYGGGVAYYCGRCYQLLGDYVAARPFYEYVVDTFSGRDIARSAAGRLAEMEP